MAGTEGDPVYFTSIKDNSVGGDTNNDGNASQPAPGDGGTIRLYSSGSVATLDHVVIRYMGTPGYYAPIYVTAGSATITHSNISQNFMAMQSDVATSVSISDSTITNNTSVTIFPSGTPALPKTSSKIVTGMPSIVIIVP